MRTDDRRARGRIAQMLGGRCVRPRELTREPAADARIAAADRVDDVGRKRRLKQLTVAVKELHADCAARHQQRRIRRPCAQLRERGRFVEIRKQSA